MKNKQKQSGLKLVRETLRQLTRSELEQVQGGYAITIAGPTAPVPGHTQNPKSTPSGQV